MDTLRALVAGTQITAIEIVFDEKREKLDSFLAERGFLIGQDGDMYRVPIGDLIYGEEMDWFLEMASFTGNVVSPVKEDCFEKMKALLAEERSEESADGISR